jgi:hypothetical protein
MDTTAAVTAPVHTPARGIEISFINVPQNWKGKAGAGAYRVHVFFRRCRKTLQIIWDNFGSGYKFADPTALGMMFREKVGVHSGTWSNTFALLTIATEDEEKAKDALAEILAKPEIWSKVGDWKGLKDKSHPERVTVRR